MLKKPVCYIIVSRYHENPVIGITSLGLLDDDVIQNISEFRHGGAAYLMNRKHIMML